MNRRGPLSICVALAAFAAGVADSRSAWAEERTCTGLQLRVDAGLAAEWVDAAREAQRQLVAAALGCTAAEVALEGPVGGTLRVVLSTPDGRRAQREVRTAAGLTATLVGLLASIAADRENERAIDRAPTGIPLDSQPAPAIDAASANRPVPVAAPIPVELAVGLSTGMRVSQPVLFDMLDLEGTLALAVRSWALVASLRYSPSFGGQSASASSYTEADAGLAVGPRITIGSTNLDLACGPSVAMMRFVDGDESGIHGTLTELRVGATLRWSLRLNPSWLATISADSEIAPEGLVHAVHLESNEAALPVWTGGLRLGALGRLL
jgi:hypothetical protein